MISHGKHRIESDGIISQSKVTKIAYSVRDLLTRLRLIPKSRNRIAKLMVKSA